MRESALKLNRLMGKSRGLLASGSIGSLMVSAWPAGLRLGGAALQLLVTVLIARYLGAEAAGVYFFWTAAMMEAGHTATFGLDSLALRQVPRHADDAKQTARFLANTRFIVLILAVVLGGLLSLYGWLGYPSGLRPVWWFILPPVCVAGVAFTLVHGDALAGCGRPLAAVFYRHTLVVASLLTLVVLLNNRLDANIAIALYVGSFVVSSAGALCSRVFRQLRPHIRRPSFRETKELLVEAFPIFLTSVFAGLAIVLPLGVLERTRDTEEVALLTTAFRIFVLFDVLAKAIHSRMMPDLSRGAFHREEGRGVYLKATQQGLVLLLLPVIGVFVLAPVVMSVFGEEFSEGFPILRLLMVFALVSLALGPARQILLMLDQTRKMAWLSAITFAITAVSAFLVVPAYGAIALACILGVGILLERLLFLFVAIGILRRTHSESSRNPGGRNK